MKAVIQKETLRFLKDLRSHNDRDWFGKHKDRYLAAHEDFLGFTQALIGEVSKFDRSVAGLEAKDCVFRIYRDIRFSRDKSPYKTHFGAVLMGKGKACGAGYYLHLEPGGTFLAGGAHRVEPARLQAIRETLRDKGKEFLKIIGTPNFKRTFTLEGERLVNVPRGFGKDDPMAEYLKYKELTIHHAVGDKQVLEGGFGAYAAKVFKEMAPFNGFLNRAVEGMEQMA